MRPNAHTPMSDEAALGSSSRHDVGKQIARVASAFQAGTMTMCPGAGAQLLGCVSGKPCQAEHESRLDHAMQHTQAQAGHAGGKHLHPLF